MKVLFLDVDGVLNCAKTKERHPCGVIGVEPAKCSLLRRVLKETGCKIVLSSTWRRHEDLLPYLWEYLGCEAQSRWIGSTPSLYSPQVRGDEIQAWLSMNPQVNRFVILDDDADMAHLKPHLLRTNWCEGMTENIANEAISRLNN